MEQKKEMYEIRLVSSLEKVFRRKGRFIVRSV